MLPPFPDGTITQFAPRTPHFIYSNFYPYSVMYEGITYPSNEHAYQAAKSLDEGVRLEILRCSTAAEAKRLGGQIIIRPGWDQLKTQVMRELIDLKFAPGTPLERSLWLTEDTLIIEGNYWHDRYWGQCFCRKHNWEGQNLLGKIIMEKRSRIEGWNQWNWKK